MSRVTDSGRAGAAMAVAAAEAAAEAAAAAAAREPANAKAVLAATRAAAAAKAAAKAAAAMTDATATAVAPVRSSAAPVGNRRMMPPSPHVSRELAAPGGITGRTGSHVERVRRRLHAWRRIGASRQVLSWLADGVRIPWNARGPPAPFNHGVGSFTPSERAWLTVERDRCFGTGAWRPATQLTHVSRAFVVYHKGKPRLVIDLRWLNEHTEQRSTRFESLSTLRRLARQHDWMWSIDLTDAYHHIPYHPDYVHYFTFAIETLAGVEYISTPALNFGWRLSPWVFTQVMRPVVAYLRSPSAAAALATGAAPFGSPQRTSSGERQGVRTLPWLDDFAFFLRGTASYAEACQHRDWTHAILGLLGLLVAIGKGQFDPTHFLEDHLGYGIDTDRGLFLLTTRRERALAHGAHQLLQHAALRARRVPARLLASFAGLGEASSLALPLARFMLRALYDDLATRRGWGGTVQLTGQTLADLRWWASLRGSRHIGRAIWRLPESRLAHSDASDLGWGFAIDEARAHRPAHGFWTPEQLPWHITLKELVAVRLGVQRFLPQLAGRRVLLREDNMAVVWILTNFVSRSPALMSELRKLWYVLDEYDIQLRPLYIRSAMNVIADYASRLAFSGDYVISLSRLRSIEAMWGRCTVDAFASPATALLPRYWTPGPIAGSSGVDAFAQRWTGERLWVHPPPSHLLTVVQMLETHACEAFVCVPHWPGAAWYGLLLAMSSDYVHLPPGSLSPVAGDAPPLVRAWPLTVFRVRGGATG